jgi:predicted transcriptional regulator
MLKLFEATDQRKQNALSVLTHLSQATATHVSVDDLAETTQLGVVIYPVLSHLHEQGMVEPHWVQRIAGPQLHYQITLKGLEYSRRAASSDVPFYARSMTKPILAKLKTWFARTDS